MQVVFEDNHIIVVNKDIGVTTVANKDSEKSLEDLVATHINRTTGYPPKYLTATHRLDRDTSGLVVLAKKKTAAAALSVQFEKKTVIKQYIAICALDESSESSIPPKRGTISGYIYRYNNMVFAFSRDNISGKGAKFSKTYYELIVQSGKYALFLLSPKTGRTHQLRLHLKHLFAPIVGDPFYGFPCKTTEPGRMLLHAAKLTFKHPVTDEKLTLSGEPSADFFSCGEDADVLLEACKSILESNE